MITYLPDRDGASGRDAKPVDFSLFYFASDENATGDKYRLLLEGAKFADRNDFARSGRRNGTFMPSAACFQTRR